MAQIAEPLVVERYDLTDVVLDRELARFLTAVVRSGKQSALVTSAGSRLSPFLDTELRHAETTWILREPDGTRRDAVTGSRIGEIRYATGPRMVDASTVPDHTAEGLVVEAVVRFRATGTVRLGAVAAQILQAIDLEAPQTWGFTEPLERPWSPEDITAAAQRAMPAQSLVRAAGRAFAWIGVRRTPRGLAESTRVLVPADALVGSLEDAVDAVTAVLTQRFQVELATMLRYPVSPTGWRLPGRVPAPTPMALVLGPRGIRELGLPGAFPTGVQSSFVGRQRLPSQLLRFTDRESAWRHLVGLGLTPRPALR